MTTLAMRSNCFMTPVLVGLLLAVSRLPSEAQHLSPTVHLLKPQDYYGRRSFGTEGDVWLGIYSVGNGSWELKPSRISVDIVPTPEGCTPEVTRVTVHTAKVPLFLVQGLQNVLEGPIDVGFIGTLFLYPGQSKAFPLGASQGYVVSAFGTAFEAGEPAIANYELHLGDGKIGGRRQILARFRLVDMNGPPEIVFAGDIDRDGQLDLILDLRQSYSGHLYTLFLSSTAANHNFVARVAELAVPGC